MERVRCDNSLSESMVCGNIELHPFVELRAVHTVSVRGDIHRHQVLSS